MTNFQLITNCIHCGAPKVEPLGDGMYRCTYCGDTFRADDLNSYGIRVHKELIQQLSGVVSEQLLKQREHDIGNARQNLYSALKEEYTDSYKIIGCCRELKKYLPDDFQANAFENGDNKKRINKCLDGIDVNGGGRYYIKDILDFMLKSLVSANVLSLKNLVDRGLSGAEKTEYLNKIEDEAYKYNAGIYSENIPRKAFIAYSSRDMAHVNEIVSYLEDAGISCFVALRNMRHGKGSVENYGNILRAAMHNCQCFVFLSSRNSRRLDCDAITVEVPYINDQEPQVKRIEYIIDDYGDEDGAKALLKTFFGESEQCRTKEDLIQRIYLATTIHNNKGEAKALKYCLNCGAENPERVKFCGECGGREFAQSYNKYLEAKNTRELESVKQKLAEEQQRKLKELEEKFRDKTTDKTETKTDGDKTTDISAVYDQAVKHYDQKDYSRAAELFKTAATSGYAKAQNYLGVCYEKGLGVTKSYEEAAKWYRKAADQGYADAQNNLGVCYKNGRGVTQSYEEAVKWYRKAADQGYADAQSNLGWCYKNGQGVTESYEEAVKWYRKAAEQGNAGAQCNLGFCYFYGRGVTQSYEEAVKWYRKAAEQGDKYAQCYLGWCYENGQSVTQSYEEAAKWYRKAADQGYQLAKDVLDRLNKR